MQIYAQILVILLTRPAALAIARRVYAIYRRHPRSLHTSHPPNFFPSIRLLASSAIRIVSLYHSVCDARFRSENAFFPSSRRAPVCAAGLR